jgi:hypothetical protein
MSKNASFILNYKDRMYTKTTETPAITFEVLLVDTGDQIHLFISLSFFTILELFKLALESVVFFKAQGKSH